MPNSSSGSGMPSSPSMPPSAMTMGKVTGNSQMAGCPSCAPQIPTATIAMIVVVTGNGMAQTAEQPRR